MKFGLQMVPAYPSGAAAAAELEHQLDQLRAARDAGFSSAWVAQHYVGAPFQYLQTIPTLGRVAAEAGHMTIGSCVLLMPLNHPVRVAEEMASLDIISLRPMQQPRPQIWMGAQNGYAIRRVARLADSWIVPPRTLTEVKERFEVYKAARAELGKPMPPELAVRIDVVLSENRQTVLDETRSALEATYDAFQRWGLSKVDPSEAVIERPLDQWAHERLIIGTPDDCLERLAGYGSVGLNHFVLRVHFPGIAPEYALRTIILLRQHVVPAFA
ncbi:MAG: LLM class flavin-dependent oxidoreductase [Chloroflexi bacterium]|nr:LLM class flavin-dependent oxidoreductase [Chloroflexota bacterium]